jgi:hypothetical protein
MSGSSSVNEFEASPLIREVREMLRRGAIGEASARVGHALAVSQQRRQASYLQFYVANRRLDQSEAD